MENDYDNLTKNLRELPRIDLPSGLHKRILNDLFFLKFKHELVLAIVILPLNLFLVGWHIWTTASTSDVYVILTAPLSEFELSFDFASNFAQKIIQNIPLSLLMAFILNFTLVIYILLEFRSMYKNLHKRIS